MGLHSKAGCPGMGGTQGGITVVCRQGTNRAAAIAIFIADGFRKSFQPI